MTATATGTCTRLYPIMQTHPQFSIHDLCACVKLPLSRIVLLSKILDCDYSSIFAARFPIVNVVLQSMCTYMFLFYYVQAFLIVSDMFWLTVIISLDDIYIRTYYVTTHRLGKSFLFGKNILSDIHIHTTQNV